MGVLGVGLTTPHPKNKLVTKILKNPQTWTDSLDMRFGTWNVRSKMDFREIGWDGMDWIDLAQIGTSGGLL
jgi:hypothetical protein